MANKNSPLGKLLTEIKTYKINLAVGTASLIFSNLSNALLPLYLGKYIFNSKNNNNLVKNNENSLFYFFVLLGAGAVSSFWRTTSLSLVEARFTARLREQVFDRVLKMNLSSFHSKRNCFSTILQEDCATVGKFGTTLAELTRHCFSVGYNLLNMLLISPRMCATSLIVTPITVFSIMKMNKFKKYYVQQRSDLLTEANNVSEECMTNITAVKLCHQEEHDSRRYASLQQKASEIDSSVAYVSGMYMASNMVLIGATLSAVIGVGKYEITQNRLCSQGLSRFLFSTLMLGLAGSRVGSSRSELSTELVAAQRLYDILDGEQPVSTKYVDSTYNDENTTRASNTPVKPSSDVYEMTNVYFRYKEDDDDDEARWVLENVSLSLPAGKVVALIGANGVGKTTLLSVLAGLYSPTRGTITYRGKGRSIAVVQQESASSLFSMSVKDNIKYSKPEATDEEVFEAARFSKSDEFIEKLENKYDYQIGRGGCLLSGGQRQKLNLARALLTNPQLLIMDEPTSQLDVDGEMAVRDAVAACRASNKSLLLVTHSQNSLKLADEVYSLENGCLIRQEAPFDGLLSQ